MISASGTLHIGDYTFTKPADMAGSQYRRYFQACQAFCKAVRHHNVEHATASLKEIKRILEAEFNTHAKISYELERLSLPNEEQITVRMAAFAAGVACHVNILDIEEDTVVSIPPHIERYRQPATEPMPQPIAA